MSKKSVEIRIHSVKYNFGMNIILKISQYIFPLITLPYITRTLGTIGNGKVAFATSVIMYFSMLAQLGIPSYGVRECAKYRDDKDKLTKTVQELLLLNGLSTFIAYLSLGICMILIPKLREEPILLLINAATIILNMFGMEWLYQAIEQYQYITIRNLLFKIASIILMFSLIHDTEDYILYGILTVFSSSGSYLLNLWNSRKILAHKLYIGQYDLKHHLRPIFTFFALAVAVSIYTSMDTVMLGFISGNKQVAYYALSTKIKMVLASSISALGPVLLPRISYCLSCGQNEKFKDYIDKSFRFVIMSAVPVTIYFIFISPQVIDILGGVEYKPAVKCMQIITLAVIPLGFGNVACSQILTPLGKEKLIMYSTIFGAIINFFSNLLLIPYLGATGAALATVIAEGIIACVQVNFVWSEVKDIICSLPYFKYLVANISAVIVLVYFQNIIKISSRFIGIIVCFILFFGTYVLILFVLKDQLIYQYGLKYIKKIISRR